MFSIQETKCLWADVFFRDPANFWHDNRHHHKRNLNSTDLKHKYIQKPCWVLVRSNPTFASDKLKEPSLLPSTSKAIYNDDDELTPKLWFHDRITLLNMIKSCQKEKNISTVRRIHADILKSNLIAKDVYIANALITAYAKCGVLEKAREVFEQLPVQNVVSWNALIGGYAQNRLGSDALKYFKQMENVGVCPNTITYICVLKACGVVRSLEIGEFVDVEIRKQGLLEKDIILGTALVDMYCKCGALERAQNVFEQLTEKTIVTWNALIAGFSQNGLGHEALKCFKQLKASSVSPNSVTYLCIFKACGISRSLEVGEDIDAEVRKQGLLQKDIMLGTACLDMYCKCGSVEKARQVFELLPQRDVVSWNTLISGYAENGFGDEALKCFKQMNNVGIPPNAVTYICILKACGVLGSLEIGDDIYTKVRNQRLLEKDIVLGTALVDMYSKCGALHKAREVFEQLPERNVVTWSTMIAGYAQNGLGDEALTCFKQMKDSCVCPNSVTYVCILKACGIVRSLVIGEEICAEVRKQGLLEKDLMLGNALVDMYSKCGVLEKAQAVFEQLQVRDVVSWNAIILGYAQNGFSDEALKYFRKMKDEEVCPNTITYICILKACGIVGSLEIGEDIDAEVRNQGLLQKDVILGTAFVDMYSKCGALKKAREIFEHLPVQNAATWNALIAGYGQLGQINVVLDLYSRMNVEGVPDAVTLLVLLNACSHAGLVKEGEKLFDELSVAYCITPTLEHYTCMVDLFGRAGCFEKVKAFLDKVPHSGHPPLFQSILSSCRKWRNEKFGRWAFEQSIQLDENCAGAYVCMGNMFATSEMQTEAGI